MFYLQVHRFSDLDELFGMLRRTTGATVMLLVITLGNDNLLFFPL